MTPSWFRSNALNIASACEAAPPERDQLGLCLWWSSSSTSIAASMYACDRPVSTSRLTAAGR
eukprot:CAMPEP_0176227104 /NCGR_PEP_ID=MMETSP0121_2-20121125/22598_1 /TAXON_ID=160619 /ORGANISM="Kryptoperidinium foliaceum, Strain CCMP 1326" /LENGTH=61 /DNA_ID=CAMNT_0017566379 /DNA_START=45 /DNA_END=227 /DNA_ORIENTATION=+